MAVEIRPFFTTLFCKYVGLPVKQQFPGFFLILSQKPINSPRDTRLINSLESNLHNKSSLKIMKCSNYSDSCWNDTNDL